MTIIKFYVFINILLLSSTFCLAQSNKQIVVDKWDYIGISDDDFLDKDKIYMDMRTIKKDEKNNYYTCKVKVVPTEKDDGTYFIRIYAISITGFGSFYEILSEQNCYFGRLAPMSEMKSPDKINWKPVLHVPKPSTGSVIGIKMIEYTKKM
jgi:hypothetical protein